MITRGRSGSGIKVRGDTGMGITTGRGEMRNEEDILEGGKSRKIYEKTGEGGKMIIRGRARFSMGNEEGTE